VADEETCTRVLLDAEQAEEGEESSAPVARIDKRGQVERGMDEAEVSDSDCLGRFAEVGVPIPVGKASAYSVEGAVTWQGRMTELQDVVIDSRDEARKAGDAMTVDVDDAYSTQLVLRDRLVGVYAQGGADAAEDLLSRAVGEPRVETERVSGEQVDKSTYCLLNTRETADRSAERSG
jgi:hypothetical protein